MLPTLNPSNPSTGGGEYGADVMNPVHGDYSGDVIHPVQGGYGDYVVSPAHGEYSGDVIHPVHGDYSVAHPRDNSQDYSSAFTKEDALTFNINTHIRNQEIRNQEARNREIRKLDIRNQELQNPPVQVLAFSQPLPENMNRYSYPSQSDSSTQSYSGGWTGHLIPQVSRVLHCNIP